MNQILSRPDRYIGLSGHLECAVTETAVPGAPDFMRGLRALFVADVHVVRRTTAGDLERFVARLGALSPDLVLLGGDYADRPEHCTRFFEALAALRPPMGCYGVLGNNDSEAWPDVDALRRLMAAAGCRLLVNAAARIDLPGGRLYVAGLDDYRYGDPRPEKLYPAAGTGRYRVLLSHYPRPVPVMPDLMLAGHTHGGQINFLGLTPFSLGFERLLRPDLAPLWVAGRRALAGGLLLVSKGVGTSRLPVRVGVRPEIELLTFTV